MPNSFQFKESMGDGVKIEMHECDAKTRVVGWFFAEAMNVLIDSTIIKIKLRMR